MRFARGRAILQSSHTNENNMPEREHGIPEEALGWKAPASEKQPLPVANGEALDNIFVNSENRIKRISVADLRKSEAKIDQLISTGVLDNETSTKADHLRQALKTLSGMNSLGSRGVIERLAKNGDHLFENALDATNDPKLREVVSSDVLLTLTMMRGAVEEVSRSIQQASVEESKKRLAKDNVS